MHKIVLLEQAMNGEVTLSQMSEANWATAQHLMDALRRVVAERGSQVLYAAILDAPGAYPATTGASEGCCREAGAKVLA